MDQGIQCEGWGGGAGAVSLQMRAVATRWRHTPRGADGDTTADGSSLLRTPRVGCHGGCQTARLLVRHRRRL